MATKSATETGKSAAKSGAKQAGRATKSGAGTAKRATDKATAPLTGQVQDLVGSARQLATKSTSAALTGMTERLTEYAAKGGGPGLLSAVTGRDTDLGKSLRKAVTGRVVKGATAAPRKALETVKEGLRSAGGRRGSERTKVTNIVESIDIGLPVRTTYDLWTQFATFPAFMKKVENVEQSDDANLTWTAQVFWSHRSWESTIIDQVPDKHIVWRSKGEKGHVDGTVSFHELAPDLTRILLSLEYYPKGLVERTGNLLRAQGRRVRLELKHFRRHAMAETLLKQDDQDGWRGEIHDGKVASGRRKAKSRSGNAKQSAESAEADESSEADEVDGNGNEAKESDQPAPRRGRKRQR